MKLDGVSDVSEEDDGELDPLPLAAAGKPLDGIALMPLLSAGS